MKIFAANFKMNKNQKETKEYLEQFSAPTGARVMIAVPFTSLCAAKKHPKNVEIGAQNVHFAPSGAYTGEISADMLQEAGATFAIVGHSERRKLYGERDDVISGRVKAAVDAGLDVIICVGESLAIREKGVTNHLLSFQLYSALSKIDKFDKVIVAYEPVWAIGTGKTAKLEDIEKTHAHIKKYLKKRCKMNVPVLYGGSVNEKNVKSICALPGVDGVLVGGASLDPNRMMELIFNGKN